MTAVLLVGTIVLCVPVAYRHYKWEELSAYDQWRHQMLRNLVTLLTSPWLRPFHGLDHVPYSQKPLPL